MSRPRRPYRPLPADESADRHADLKESRPSMLVEYFARAISYFAGRFPLAEANRGKNSWDSSLEEECASAGIFSTSFRLNC